MQESSGGAGRLLQWISGLYEAMMMFNLLSPPGMNLSATAMIDPVAYSCFQTGHTERVFVPYSYGFKIRTNVDDHATRAVPDNALLENSIDSDDNLIWSSCGRLRTFSQDRLDVTARVIYSPRSAW